MIEIVKANTSNDFSTIATLADSIWRSHYEPIIGLPQVNYMLEKFQSLKAIESQVGEGFEYYLLHYNALPVGYISIKREDEALFLSKIYVLSSYRGKKIGKTAMTFIEKKAKDYTLKSIRLTVNINNVNSIRAYEKMGFKKAGPIVIDIGNGFIMDDFEMIKTLLS